MKQLQILRQPTDWVGPVFCNTVRPLLLVQGKWSYQVSIHAILVQQPNNRIYTALLNNKHASFKVEIAWRLLFRHLVRKNRTFDDDSDEE